MATRISERRHAVFADLGLDLSTAIEMFLRPSVREQRIPFEVSRKIPNAETLIYQVDEETPKLYLIRTDAQSDLF